jgi:hypothetical protein
MKDGWSLYLPTGLTDWWSKNALNGLIKEKYMIFFLLKVWIILISSNFMIKYGKKLYQISSCNIIWIDKKNFN